MLFTENSRKNIYLQYAIIGKTYVENWVQLTVIPERSVKWYR